MKFFIFILPLLLAMSAIAQNGQAPVSISKHFTLYTFPQHTDIFTFDEKGAEQKLGTDMIDDLQAGKREQCIIEVRKEGYQAIRRVYVREKGGIDEDTIRLTTRMIKLTAMPAESEIFVNDVSVGKGTYNLPLARGRKANVEIKCPGYVSKSKVLSNADGDAEPGLSYDFKLEDRVMKVKATPADADIYVNGVKAGQGTADVVVNKYSCADVAVKHAGFSPKTETYCNNETPPPLSAEIHLTERVSQVNTDPANAVISADGKEVATGSYEVTIPEGQCVDVTASAPGYVTAKQKICNKAANQPEASYTLRLQQDETIAQSEENAQVNTDFMLEVNPGMTAADAWKKLCAILQSYGFTIDLKDDQAWYLRTQWAQSGPYNESTAFPRTIRTRVDVKSGGAKPLKYIITIKSEVSKTGRDCVNDDRGYPAPNRDECFDPFARLARRYKELTGEMQARLGVNTDVAVAPGAAAGQSGAGQAVYGEPEGVANNAEGKYFVGTWHCVDCGDTIIISNAGDNYTLEKQGKKMKVYSREDYLISKDPAIGKITWKGAHLLWLEKEFEDVKVAGQ